MSRFLYLFRAAYWLTLSFIRAAWYFRIYALKALELPQELLLTSRETRRFKHYFYGASYLAALMNGLRNRFSSPTEEQLFAKLAGLSFCFDDLADAFQGDFDPEQLGLTEPEAFAKFADKRGLALHLLHNIYQHLPQANKAGFQHYMQRVFRVETTGRQAVTSTDGKTLAASTAEKGGASVLLFRSLLAQPPAPEETRAFYEFGYLIQFCDDIFDLWHDKQMAISTEAGFYAEHLELDTLDTLFQAQVNHTYQAFRQIPYPHKQVQTSLYIIHVLVSITRVCLRHYQDLEKRYGYLPLDKRTEIVVDMEQWSNRFRVVLQLFRPLQ